MSRSRRLVSGLDAGFAAVLALALLLILNYLAHRWDRTFDWTASGDHTLSEKTLTLLREGAAKQKDKVRIVTFFSPRRGYEGQFEIEQELQARVQALLDRYKAACPSLVIEHVSPDQDIQRAKALAQELLDTPNAELNSVVLSCGKRHKTVSETALGDPDAGRGHIGSFKAENAISSALDGVDRKSVV